METPHRHRTPASRETRPPAAAASSGTGERRCLAGLSDPELDLLISLKMLAVKQAETAGRPHLADAFDLRRLRALGVVLLESFKGRLKETALDPLVLDKLVLSRDSYADVSVSGGDSEVFRWRSNDRPKPNSVKRKIK